MNQDSVKGGGLGIFLPTPQHDYVIDAAILEGAGSGKILITEREQNFAATNCAYFQLKCERSN